MKNARRSQDNPLVYFDVTVGGEPIGRVLFELFKDVTPKTAENFRQLCTGEAGIGKTTGKPLHYKGVPFHRIIPSFMCQGGDFSARNGTGGESIYGEKFEDENFELKHDKKGLLSMANAGPGTNGSQFFITVSKTPHLDEKHVVFGQVVRGYGVVREMERVQTADSDAPIKEVLIADCGELAVTALDQQPGNSEGGADEGLPEYPDDADIPLGDDGTAFLLTSADSLKAQGNGHFKEGNYAAAARIYSQALRYLDYTASEEEDGALVAQQPEELSEKRPPLLLNRAACRLKTGAPESAKADCSEVLERNDKNAKALFRRGQASVALKELESAVSDLEAAAQLAPHDKGIRAELVKAKRELQAREAKFKGAFKKMFG